MKRVGATAISVLVILVGIFIIWWGDKIQESYARYVHQFQNRWWYKIDVFAPYLDTPEAKRGNKISGVMLVCVGLFSIYAIWTS